MDVAELKIRAFLGLGTNQGDRIKTLDRAVKNLGAYSCITSLRVSPLYETAPWGLKDQPGFINQVVEIVTGCGPYDLLSIAFALENAAGRERTVRWGPRTLDVDILLFGKLRMQDEGLRIPHPHLAERRFVLRPLADLAPDLWVPGHNRTARELLDRCNDDGDIALYRQEATDPS
ncbi:2-amino-4-hydroxy-6-hydroxymethyldihydropteridine diphosphokinase [bacterium]|nr:2-amino-4-hydroxy-6-hydroxymethyldihydropteridine diphosphokinase [bacterium]